MCSGTPSRSSGMPFSRPIRSPFAVSDSWIGVRPSVIDTNAGVNVGQLPDFARACQVPLREVRPRSRNNGDISLVNPRRISGQ
jgi:hypothetical protein